MVVFDLYVKCILPPLSLPETGDGPGSLLQAISRRVLGARDAVDAFGVPAFPFRLSLGPDDWGEPVQPLESGVASVAMHTR